MNQLISHGVLVHQGIYVRVYPPLPNTSIYSRGAIPNGAFTNLEKRSNPIVLGTQEDMMQEMRRIVRDTSLIVKNLFSQFDLHARGCVSGEQFLRVVSCHALLSADKVRGQCELAN